MCVDDKSILSPFWDRLTTKRKQVDDIARMNIATIDTGNGGLSGISRHGLKFCVFLMDPFSKDEPIA